MTAILGAALLAFTTLGPADGPWCGRARITGYSRYDHGSHTYDGTNILTPEPIAAASWDVRLGAYVDIPEVGTFRIADRGGGLGHGTPMPWVDVAVWSRAEAYALTSVRTVCFRRSAS